MKQPEFIKLRRSYFIGFILAFVLTITAFWVTNSYITGSLGISSSTLVAGLVTLATLQLFVQLIFFFHLARETKPRLNSMSFMFMAMVVLIIGLGSIWIMNNLNYNMMGEKAAEYILQDELPTQDDSSSMHHHEHTN